LSPPAETQPERTALAWQRTGLGVLAVAVLLGHRAMRYEQPALLVLAGAAALLGLAVLGALAPARYREIRRTVAAGTGAAGSRAAGSVTAVVLLVGVLAAVAVVLTR
jgi:putative membrane protein